MVIIADHGNVEFVGEYLKNNKELTDTEHNANPVPCIVINGQNPTSVIQRDFSQEWVTSAEVETLRKTALPLWKAGEILLNL
jgi:bisphosphoglycerate-independent phosphoglycerate mutase (AlkP superfamily)